MRFPLLIAVLAAAAEVTHAANPQCHAPPSATCKLPTSCASPPCKPPCPPCEGQRREAPPEEGYETGVYVAPPRSGTTQGPVRRLGIQGLSITFPEVRLRLPSLEFPSLVRSRTESRMVLDQAVAPYVSTGYQAPNAQPRSAPPDDCEERLRQLQAEHEQLQAKARELQQMLEQQRGSVPKAPCRTDRGPAAPLPAPVPPPETGSRPRSSGSSSQAYGWHDAPPPGASGAITNVSHVETPPVARITRIARVTPEPSAIMSQSGAARLPR